MAFERFIADQLGGVEQFLANPRKVALEIERASDLAMLAAKVIVAGQDDVGSSDLYITVDQPFVSAPQWCEAVAAAVAASLSEAEPAMAEQGIELELPAGIDSRPSRSQLGVELRLLEYLETIARGLGPWLRSVVVLWDSGERPDTVDRAAWVAMVTQLFAASGSGQVKWIVFSEPGHPWISGLEPARPRAQTWPEILDRYGTPDPLARFVADPCSRLLTYQGDSRATGWFRGQFLRTSQLVAGQTQVLVVDDEAFFGPLWFYRVAALAIARQLRELELHNFGSDERIAPFVARLERHLSPLRAERWFMTEVEQMLDALGDVNVALLLAPRAEGGFDGLEASLVDLAAAIVRTNVSVIFVAPGMPERGVTLSTEPVGCQRFDLDHSRIAAEIRDAVADPDLPDAARVPYLTALAGLAIGEDEPERAVEDGLAAVAAAQAGGDPSAVAVAQYVLGNSLYHIGGFAAAEQAYAATVDLVLSHDLALIGGYVLLGLGNCRFVVDDFDRARHRYAIANTYFEKSGHRFGQIHAMTWLAEAARRKNDWRTSRDEFDRALALCDGVDPNFGRAAANSKADVLLRLARLFDAAGMPDEADQRRSEARSLGASVEPDQTPS